MVIWKFQLCITITTRGKPMEGIVGMLMVECTPNDILHFIQILILISHSILWTWTTFSFTQLCIMLILTVIHLIYFFYFIFILLTIVIRVFYLLDLLITIFFLWKLSYFLTLHMLVSIKRNKFLCCKLLIYFLISIRLHSSLDFLHVALKEDQCWMQNFVFWVVLHFIGG